MSHALNCSCMECALSGKTRYKDGKITAEVKREFSTGATRDTDRGKIDYEGFLDPMVLEAFGAYMNFNRTMRDGSQRDSDNWQRGFPQDVLVKSMLRHTMDVWKWQRGYAIDEDIIVAICAQMFNSMALLRQLLRDGIGGYPRDKINAALAREQNKRDATKAVPEFGREDSPYAAPMPEHAKGVKIMATEKAEALERVRAEELEQPTVFRPMTATEVEAHRRAWTNQV